MSSIQAPRAQPIVRAPIDHPATRAVRDAEALLDKADLLLSSKNTDTLYPSLSSALLASQQTPQYRRTFIQGCACSTGIAGGGCCPGSATAAAQGGAGLHAHGGGMGAAAMAPMGVFGGVLGLYGIYSGVKVLRNTADALQNLAQVRGYIDPKLNEAVLYNAQLAAYPSMVHTQSAAAHVAQALRGYQRDLKVSTQEQHFNRAVPGALQVGAAAATTLAAVNELGMGFLGGLGGCVIGALGASLFAVYGGLMSAKNVVAYFNDKKTRPIERSENLPDAYRVAVNSHLKDRLSNNGKTAAAWAGVGLAGVFGTLVAAGAIGFPFAWAAVAGVALVAAGWAIWQNSRTRYVPHLPISPHVQREHLVTPEQRASAWRILSAQDAAIKVAVQNLTTFQTRLTRLRFDVERLFKPQCGPSAFRVLSDRVQGARGKSETSAEVLREAYERIQHEALVTYVAKERELLLSRSKEASDTLTYRLIEMKALVDPCCDAMTRTAHQALSPDTLTEAVYTQASTTLRDDAAQLALDVRKLGALDKLGAALEALRDDVGKLGAVEGKPMSTSQQQWLYARLNVLQLSGTLGDAVSADFIAQHPQYFSRNTKAHALPLNNVYVLPQHVEKFAIDIASELDGAFVHAFFNPRRIEAEMDFIVDFELSGRRNSQGRAVAVSETAPACDGGTCCR